MKCVSILFAVIFGLTASVFGQTDTSGEIAGLVTDATGARVSHASVNILNKDNGTHRNTATNSEGIYRVPLLPPGIYTVTVTAPSFQTFAHDNVTVDIGHAVHLDFKLQVGSFSTKIEVTSEAPLLEPTNPNTTTSYSERDLTEIPNPGSDMSHVAVIAPGAIMNVGASNTYAGGNVEFNGLSSVANDFRVDGLDANDSWENLNRSGATGLQLGLASIQEASVNTEGYGADQSSYGASQINFITKSGTNSFHGSLTYNWNGSVLNTTNYFTKLYDATAPAGAVLEKKPRSNVNQFAGSLGGPIVKNRLFFFGSVEGTRIVLPALENNTLPTPAYEAYVLTQLPVGGYDPALGITLPPQPGEVADYKSLFTTLGDTSGGTPIVVPGCPLTIQTTGDGCAAEHHFSTTPPASETLYTGKVDYNITAKDTTFYRLQWDDGKVLLPSSTNAIWNLGATWPQRSVVARWAHTFSPNLLNEFNPGFNYWSRVHKTVNPDGTAFPIMMSATPFSLFGSGQNEYGNSTRAWQISDNLTWAHGRHSFRFGSNTRHSRFGSFETVGYAVIPFVYTCSLYEFTFGAACQTYQAFPTYGIDHISNVATDNYAMDTIRVTTKFTFTFGLRLTYESNPTSQEHVLARLSNTFEAISHDPNQPLNQVIVPNQSHLFAATHPFKWQPRAAIAYQLMPKTIVRAGGGVFANPLLGFLPSYADENAPSDVFVEGGIFGAAGGIGMFPGVPGSAIDADVAANRAFQQGFSSGVQSCAASSPPPNCIPPINFTIFDSQKQKFPDIYQWSFGVEQQFGNNLGLTVKYVGTRSTHGFYSDTPNGYQLFCNGCFTGYPYAQPVDARFGDIFPFKTGTNSSYNGLQVSTVKRFSQGFSLQMNYTYSHCIDEITNGGVIIFNANENFGAYNGALKRLYGNCDFDFRHSLNGSYIYQLPFRSGRTWLNQVVGNWQVSGTIFARDGLPFSVFSPSVGGFVNASPPLFANVVSGQKVYNSQSVPNITTPGTIQYLNPYAFQSVMDPTTGGCYPANTPQYCQQGDSGRNAYRSPKFVWSDFTLTKRFPINETIKLRMDLQAYNVFNHPNFGLPSGAGGYPGNANAGIPSESATLSGFGTINNTVGPATSLLGGQIGGDSSVRMVALRVGLDF
jgi:hypothetical protein